jgi:hypothetical protein
MGVPPMLVSGVLALLGLAAACVVGVWDYEGCLRGVGWRESG